MKQKWLKKGFSVLLIIALVGGLAGCQNENKESGSEKKEKYVVGFSQRSMDHPLLVAMVEENIAYAKENYPDMEIVVTDANGSASKQVSDVEDLIAREVDIIMISPQASDSLTDVAERAMDAGIPVICIDRNVETEVTSFIGADNKPMGEETAKILEKELNGKGKIIEIQGTAGASATNDRSAGFNDYIAKNCPEMEIISTQYCDFMREEGMKYMEDMLQRFKPGEISAVYAHNDEMALGAYEAIKASGRSEEGILICGLDGTEVAYEAIDQGIMLSTVIYPYGAPEAVQVANKILQGESYEKQVDLDIILVNSENIKEYLGTGK